MNKKSYAPEKTISGRRVSSLMLERYRLGEVTEEERKLVEAELSGDEKLRSRAAALENSDRELRGLYPFSVPRQNQQPLNANQSVPSGFGRRAFGRQGAAGRFFSGKLFKGLCAAAALACVFFPSLYYFKAKSGAETGFIAAAGTDRAKGAEVETELFMYLDESAERADEARGIPDRTFLKEGSTVQLAYTVPPGAVRYGVIFSIDGRSALTLHYPYRKEQSPVLTAGRRTFLNEAYTLDDAPDFEVFFMVTSRGPLDAESVLETAGNLASDPGTALEKCGEAFAGCEVKTITIRK